MEWESNVLKRFPWYSDWQGWEIGFVKSSVKSAERYRNLRKQNETRSEVSDVSYRSGVYKMYMVRMAETPDKSANVRV